MQVSYHICIYWSIASDFLIPTIQNIICTKEPVVRGLYKPTGEGNSNNSKEQSSLTRVERVPWILVVHSKSDPLRDNLLLALINWATTVFSESIVHLFSHGINVAKKHGTSLDRFHVHTSVSKVGASSFSWESAVHDHCGHSVYVDRTLTSATPYTINVSIVAGCWFAYLVPCLCGIPVQSPSQCGVYRSGAVSFTPRPKYWIDMRSS